MAKDVAEQNALLYNIYRELSLSVLAGSSRSCFLKLLITSMSFLL